MISDDKREAIEAEYDMPVERLMYHFYWEQDMSRGDIAAELDESRSTVQYWLDQSGIQMRSRQLSDVQRVLMMAYLDAGLGDGSIAHRVGCGRMTVNRFRKQLEADQEPPDLDSWVSAEDYALLCEIVKDTAGEREA